MRICDKCGGNDNVRETGMPDRPRKNCRLFVELTPMELCSTCSEQWFLEQIACRVAWLNDRRDACYNVITLPAGWQFEWTGDKCSAIIEKPSWFRRVIGWLNG